MIGHPLSQSDSHPAPRLFSYRERRKWIEDVASGHMLGYAPQAKLRRRIGRSVSTFR